MGILRIDSLILRRTLFHINEGLKFSIFSDQWPIAKRGRESGRKTSDADSIVLGSAVAKKETKAFVRALNNGMICFCVESVFFLIIEKYKRKYDTIRPLWCGLG